MSQEEKASEKHHEAQKQSSGNEEESLTTILDTQQRTQLIILLATATASMREALSATFDASATLSSEAAAHKEMSEDDKIMNPNIDPGSADVSAHDKERKMMAAREKELSAPKMRELREAALDWYDSWRKGVIGRVGEVINSKNQANKHIENPSATNQRPTPMPKSRPRDLRKIDPGSPMKSARGDLKLENDTLHELYPPIKTPLAQLQQPKRILILHSMLLLLISLEHYHSPSRILLLYLTTSLRLPLSVLNRDEQKTAHGLLEAAKELSGSSEAEKKVAENQTSRKWKVGLASVAGAAVIGITGGLAAPLVAAGVGSVMGGLGLGATAAAGYLGTVAGSTVIVGGLFGAYGGRMTGQMMDAYAREVEDFAFIPIREKSKHHFLQRKSEKDEEEAGKQNPSNRRLRVTIGITGWLTEKEEVVTPWRVIGHNSEVFALRWELESLMNLGNAMTAMVSSAAWGYAKKEIISHTIFAEMMAAMWPIGLLKISRVVDNPFSVAKSRAEKAGAVLADALINRAQGERPVTLIGYSLGARVIYACLLSLAARRAFGLVDSVVMIGAPLPSESKDWRVMRSVVGGRLVNVFSENDYVLGFLYRTSSIQLGVAGLQKVDGVMGVENVDVSEKVSGHLRYRYLVGSILRKIGFEDVDIAEVEKEEEALRVMEEEERKKAEALKKHIPGRSSEGSKDESELSDGDAEKEAEKMERSVQEKTQISLMARGAELLHLGGRGPKPDSSQEDKSHDSEYKSSSSYLSMPKQVWPFGGSDAKNEAAAASKAEVSSSEKGDEREKSAPARSYLEMATEGWKKPTFGMGAGKKEKEGEKEEEKGSSEAGTKSTEAQEGEEKAGAQKSYLRSAADHIPWKK